MHTEVLTYDADGLLMQSYLYFEDGPSHRPGVLVFPEAFGLSQHAKTQAQRLAELGYIALACDLHGEGKLFEDLKSAGPIIEALRKEPVHIRARAKGGLDALVLRPEVDASRVAAIGYCFGGTMALELARGGNPIVGVVGFHSGLATVAPQDAHNIKGKVLVCIGADDPVIPL
ncbi:MAG: dienelactone hydrolase family protein, partial [Verrucomicrobia bacterium]|nr:dienelactone hydrolase family protein [Verrucomicrobiota bacterium]